MAMQPLQIPVEVAQYKRVLTKEERIQVKNGIKSGKSAGRAFLDMLKATGTAYPEELDGQFPDVVQSFDDIPF